jgi:hypothetical protein
MDEFYYNCSTNEANSHSPFEVLYGFQPSTTANRLIPLTCAIVEAADKLTMIANIKDGVHQLIKILKERMADKSSSTAPLL